MGKARRERRSCRKRNTRRAVASASRAVMTVLPTFAVAVLRRVVVAAPARKRRGARAAVLGSVALLSVSLAAPQPARGTEERYQLGTSLHLPIRSFDGTLLDGWVHLPAVAPGTRVPVVLDASPSRGHSAPAAADIENRGIDGFNGSATAPDRGAIPFLEFVRRGYAVALYNTRGSGNSEGCMDLLGPNEQADAKVLVEELAGRSFSNGRVATIGQSYRGSIALAAAAAGARGLRAVLASNPVTDVYTALFTPQGAANNTSWLVGLFYQAATAPPPADGSGRSSLGTVTSYPVAAAGSVCPDVQEQLRATTLDLVSDDRDHQFWLERNLLGGLARSKTPVLMAGGFHDPNTWNYQEFDWWTALRGGPRRLLLSQGGHTWPQRDGFNDEVFSWLDHYLRGIGGEPATVGVVEYQDGGGRWHRDDAWPPRAARNEVLYLGGHELATQPGGGDRSYRTTVDPVNHTGTEEFLASEPGDAPFCPGGGDSVISAAYTSGPVSERTVIAGNPMAYLRITSDQPGGIVEVALYKVPAGGCGADGTRFFGFGMADLRFHKGGFRGENFPVGEPTPVRVDIGTMAEALEPGERLLVVLSAGEGFPSRYTPQITVHGKSDGGIASQLVLPVAQGTLGGRAPKVDYPPRPHALDLPGAGRGSGG